MKDQQLYSLTRQAIDKFHMIEEGDVIAIGISGGKDSLTLLHALSGLQRFYPKHFSIMGITVDLGYSDLDLEPISTLCQKLGVEYHVVKTRINEMLPKDSSPCSLCARLRKGAFNEAALMHGCNKIAYAHHMDDVIETMMLSLVYEGRFSTFWPVTPLEKTGLTLIRPMIFVPESDIRGFVNRKDLQVVKNPCPYEPETQRAYIKELIRQMNRHAPGVKKRMLTAILKGDLEGWKQEITSIK